MANCNYCGGRLREEHYEYYATFERKRKKIQPPIGAKDMNLYQEYFVVAEELGYDFAICTKCGAVYSNGYAISPERYRELVRKYHEFKAQPGAVRHKPIRCSRG